MSDFGSLLSILSKSTLRNAAYLLFNGALIALILFGAYIMRESLIADEPQGAEPSWAGYLIAVSRMMLMPSLLAALAIIDSVFLSESLLRRNSNVALLHFSTLELSLSYSVFCLLIWAARTALLLGIGYSMGCADQGAASSTFELVGLISVLLLNCGIGLPLVSILIPLMGGRRLEIGVIILLLTSIPMFVQEGLKGIAIRIPIREVIKHIAPLAILLLLSFLASIVVLSIWISLRKSSALQGFLTTEKDIVGNQSKA